MLPRFSPRQIGPATKAGRYLLLGALAVTLATPPGARGFGSLATSDFNTGSSVDGSFLITTLSNSEIRITANANVTAYQFPHSLEATVGEYDVCVTSSPLGLITPAVSTDFYTPPPTTVPPFYFFLGDAFPFNCGGVILGPSPFGIAFGNGEIPGFPSGIDSWTVSGNPGDVIYITSAAFIWTCYPPGGQPWTAYDYVQAVPLIYTFGSDPYATSSNMPPGFGNVRFPNSNNNAGDPVDVTTGEFSQSHVDLHVNGPLPIEIRRTYSPENSVANELGYGWLTGYPNYLDVSSDLSTIQASDGNGAVILFRRPGGVGTIVNGQNTWTPLLSDNPSISASGGSTNLLNSTITVTTTGYQWNLPDGSIRYYSSALTFATGGPPSLSKITDNRGNSLTFSYGSGGTIGNFGRISQITSSNGTSVTFTYNFEGLLSQAVANDGRTVTYTYNTQNDSGDLIGVQYPDGTSDTYQYGSYGDGGPSNHLITQVNYSGNRTLVNTYDENNRVVGQMATVGLYSTLAQFATFDYSVPGQTTVKDPLGNSTIYQYSGNLITKITDPLGRSTTQAWYNTTNPSGAYQNSLQSVTDKRGLVTNYFYDSLGNVVQTLVTGDLEGTGGSETAVTSAAYSGINQLVSTTDASGITTQYSYANSGYQYLPTQIVTSKGGTTIRTDQLSYVSQVDPLNPNVFSAGLLAQKVTAAGSPSQATTQYVYNPQGFLVQKTDVTGTSDPNVVSSYTYSARGELATVTDGDNRSTAYTYDGMSRPLTKVVSNESGVVLGTWTTTYDGSGDVVQVVGPRTGPSNVEHWVYDGWGRLLQDTVSRIQADTNGAGIALANAGTTNYSVDAAGNMTSSTDPLGNVTTYGHDTDGELTSKVTAGLRSESFQYEAGGNVSSYTNPLGGVTQKSYTTTGKLCHQQNPDGSVLQWQYYNDGRLQKETLRNESYWLVTYDDVAQTVTRTLTRLDGTPLASETDSYDLRGNLVSHTDVDGNTTTTSYDGLNRVKVTAGPGGTTASAQRTVTTSYGASAKTLCVQDGLGETTTTTYDALGRPLLSQVTDAGNNSVRLTTFTNSADNNSVQVTKGSGAGAITSTTYTDITGNVLLAVKGDGTFTYNTYDLDGNLLSATDALGQTTLYTYNALNQRVTQTLPDGTLTNFTYDASGNLLTRAMAGGALNLVQTFDSAGRKLTEALVAGGASTRQYSYAYYPSNSPWAGLLETTTAPRSTVTVSYDDFLRPQTIATAGSLPETNTTTTYAYDNRGLATAINQSSVNNAAGPATQVARSYDGYGNILTDMVTVGGQAVSNVSETWDAAGRRSSVNEASSTLPAPLFSYQHRADGLMTQVSSNNQNYSFGYGDNGLITSRTNPYRALSVDSRDAAGRILQETTSVSGSTTMVEDMTWRGDSTLGSYAVARNGMGAWNESRAYAYNSRGQLVNEGFSPSTGLSSSVAYTFDGNSPGLGIRTDAKVGTGAPSQWEESALTTNSFAQVTQDQFPNSTSVVQANGIALGADHVNILVDGNSQGQATFPGWTDPVGAWSISLSLAAGNHTLTANAVHPSGLYTATANSTFTVAGTPGGDVTNTFDADGNITTRSWPNGVTQTLTWDAFGRLVKVSQRDGSGSGYDWSATYDGLGRRVGTNLQPVLVGAANGTASATTSIYDPQVEFLEIGVALNGSKAWKVYGPDLNGQFGGLQGTGGLEATILDSGGTTQGVINDQFGNGVASVTGSTVTWSATRVGAYGPLPGTQATTLTDITQLAAATAWRGRRIDPTGFYDLGARYYEPTSGRFLSADPMEQAASPSLYDFCGGDPINGFDADGRSPNQVNIQPFGVVPIVIDPDSFSFIPCIQSFLPSPFNLDPGNWGLNPVDPNPVGQNTPSNASTGVKPTDALDVVNSVVGTTSDLVSKSAKELQAAGLFVVNGKSYSQTFYGNQWAGYTAEEIAAAKASQATLATAGRVITVGGAVIGAGIAAVDVYEGGGSNESLAKGAVGVIGTASAFIPVVGPVISVAISVTNAAGGFDSFYNNFNNTPRFGKQFGGAGGSW